MVFRAERTMSLQTFSVELAKGRNQKKQATPPLFSVCLFPTTEKRTNQSKIKARKILILML